jgi:hypothetical protein
MYIIFHGNRTDKRSVPKAGSLTQMLIQALNSQDKKLLEVRSPTAIITGHLERKV